MNFKHLLMVVAFLSIFTNAKASEGYEIKIKLKDYEAKTATLGFHYGNKQYIKDSTTIDANGWLIFKGNKALDPGIYILIMKPKNVYFEILISQNEQHFMMESTVKDVADNMKVTGSNENIVYYDYLNKVSDLREAIVKIKDEAKTGISPDKATMPQRLEAAQKALDSYQRLFMEQNKGTFAAAIVKASRDIDVPEFTGTDKEIKTKRYFYYKKHFFDNFEMDNERMIRTPLLFSRVDYYINKLSSQEADSLNTAVDEVLAYVKNAPESFKFFCTHYLNFYAKSDIIGHDAIYVNMAQKYYGKGLTPWVAKDQLDGIIKNAKDIEPTIIGKQAKDFSLTLRDGKQVRLYDIKSNYTILMFWAPDCGHCKEEMPDVVKFYQKWKEKGVYLLGICNRFEPDKITECWKFMDERPDMKFPVGVDLYLQGDTQTNYYVKQTPMVFILDKDKKIILKKIKPAELDEVMTEIIKFDAEKIKQGK
jgi:peroxiredoxin